MGTEKVEGEENMPAFIAGGTGTVVPGAGPLRSADGAFAVRPVDGAGAVPGRAPL